MPITLMTGLPGHGKSLEAVRMMRDDYKDRKIYAANFPGLAYDFLGAEEFDPLNWTECDSGSILFIDEAWEYFEARGPQKMPPDVIKELARHRHYGLDLVLICQGPFQLDSHIRSLIETHIHVIRPFGMKYSIIRTFRGVEKDPDGRFARKNAADTSKRRNFDKKLFDYYTSAEVHTIKRKIPLKMVGAIAVILLTIGAIWNMISWGMDFMGETDESGTSVATSGVSLSDPLGIGTIGSSGNRRSAKMISLGDDDYLARRENMKAEYFLAEQPLIEGAPWTAQKWLDVADPESFPKPRCMLAEEINKCICHSQQGTTMEVEYSMCEYIAVNGYFDPTREHVIDLDEHQDQLAKAEQFGRQEALKEAKFRQSVSTSTRTSTLPYILERLRDDRYIRPSSSN